MEIIKIIVIPLALLSTNSFSSEKFVGVDYKSLNYEPIGIKEKIPALAVNYEFFLNKHFSAEIYVGSGIDEINIETELSDVEVEIEHLWGVLLKFQYPVGDSLSMYAKVGYNEVRGKATALSNGVGSSDTVSDPLYGIGSTLNLNKKNRLYLEYINYIDDSDIKFDGFSFGYKYRI